MRPDTRPACCLSVSARRMAKGEMVPSRVIGTMNKTSTETKEPANTAICSWSKASAPPPADKIARRQIDQNQSDDAGPHQVAGAEHGTQQPRSSQLHRQRGH